MVIIVPISFIDKLIFEQLQRESYPGEAVRAAFRALKPGRCAKCGHPSLNGHGWRNRSLLTTWKAWGVVWYWRVKCLVCKTVHRLIPEIAVPDLLYSTKVVAEVMVGRVAGEGAKAFEPHPRTQKRWWDRLMYWWLVAQSLGAVQLSLEEACRNLTTLQGSIQQCAAWHVGLFFPFRDKCRKKGVGKPRGHPAIATHQTCP